MFNDIHPISVNGFWDEGYVLDKHTRFSSYIGEDDYGNPQFEITRTELGEALYQFKYQSNYAKLNDIMEFVIPFLRKWKALHSVDFVVPVPFSKNRIYHPANEIAKSISNYIRKPYAEVLKKTNTVEAKDLTDKSQIQGTIVLITKPNGPHKILLVDDLFASGATLNECAKVLKSGECNKIFVIAMTRTNK